MQFTQRDEPTSFRRGDIMWTGYTRYVMPVDEDGIPDHDHRFAVGYVNFTGRKLYRTRSRYLPHQGAKERARRIK